MSQYIKILQGIELEMLKAITAVCDQLGLRYVLLFGTLLGAVRHQGFIPWDDDIDIGMPREDYERFVQEAQPYLPPHLFIQHYTTEPNSNCPWAKVRNTNTLFLEHDNKDYDINHGIFIDIFPIDRCGNSRRDAFREHLKIKMFLMITGSHSKAYVDRMNNPTKRLVAKAIRAFILRNRPIADIIRKEDLRRKKLHKRGGDMCLLNQTSRWCGTFPFDAMFDVCKLPFGDAEFACPRDYDKYLSDIYGNYMQLPPEDKRVTHQPLKVVFDLQKQDSPVQ